MFYNERKYVNRREHMISNQILQNTIDGLKTITRAVPASAERSAAVGYAPPCGVWRLAAALSAAPWRRGS